jgi:membrane associated rhomboid family serine protease
MMLNRILPSEAMYFVGVMWAVFIIDLVLPGITFNHLGILPRNIAGLPGILLSPFLHGGFNHLISNSIPLLVLPALIRLSIGRSQMLVVMVGGSIGSGLGTWLFGSNNLVIGASGVVYALIGFLIADAWFSPTLRSWGVAIISFVLYGSVFLSFFVFLPYISWVAHFWGLGSGIAIASFLKKSPYDP